MICAGESIKPSTNSAMPKRRRLSMPSQQASAVSVFGTNTCVSNPAAVSGTNTGGINVPQALPSSIPQESSSAPPLLLPIEGSHCAIISLAMPAAPVGTLDPSISGRLQESAEGLEASTGKQSSVGARVQDSRNVKINMKASTEGQEPHVQRAELASVTVKDAEAGDTCETGDETIRAFKDGAGLAKGADGIIKAMHAAHVETLADKGAGTTEVTAAHASGTEVDKREPGCMDTPHAMHAEAPGTEEYHADSFAVHAEATDIPSREEVWTESRLDTHSAGQEPMVPLAESDGCAPKFAGVPTQQLGTAWRGPVLDEATLQALAAHMHEGDTLGEGGAAVEVRYCERLHFMPSHL
jgi:hypothetical protein